MQSMSTNRSKSKGPNRPTDPHAQSHQDTALVRNICSTNIPECMCRIMKSLINHLPRRACALKILRVPTLAVPSLFRYFAIDSYCLFMNFALVSLATVIAVKHRTCHILDACFEVVAAIGYHRERRDPIGMLVTNISQYIIPNDAVTAKTVAADGEVEEYDIQAVKSIQTHLKNVASADTESEQVKALDNLKQHLLARYDILFKDATGEKLSLFTRSRNILTSTTTRRTTTTTTAPTTSAPVSDDEDEEHEVKPEGQSREARAFGQLNTKINIERVQRMRSKKIKATTTTTSVKPVYKTFTQSKEVQSTPTQVWKPSFWDLFYSHQIRPI